MKSQSFNSVYLALAIKLVKCLAKIDDEMYDFFLSASTFVRIIEVNNGGDDDDADDDDADDDNGDDDDIKKDFGLFVNPDMFII